MNISMVAAMISGQVPICSLYETFDAGGRDLLVPPGVYNLEVPSLF